MEKTFWYTKNYLIKLIAINQIRAFIHKLENGV